MLYNTLTQPFKTHMIPVALAIWLLTGITTKTISAKSLYIIADKGRLADATQPVHAYDIGSDGTLTFQTQCDIPHRMLGAIGMAIDSQAGYLFITYDRLNKVHIVDAQTMTNVGIIDAAPDGVNLAGIVYDAKKKRLYCAEVGTKNLYVFEWEPENLTLTDALFSPFILKKASIYGIALDEVNNQLYVANASDTITVYDTSSWTLIDSIELNRIAISIAIDVENEFVYTGGGYADNTYLTQYHLATGTKREVQVEPDAGVMGLGVDPNSSLIYLSTGRNNQSGGDNLLVFDSSLDQIDIITSIGNPTGLAIPDGDVAYNPFNLSKTIIAGTTNVLDDDGNPMVGAGGILTYAIHFENNNADPINEVKIVDTLPGTLIFVSAENDVGNGQYDSKTHTYEWSFSTLPPQSSITLELNAKVKKDTQANTEIKNAVTIRSLEIAPTTKTVSIKSSNNALNLTKSISSKTDDSINGIDPDEPITYTITFDNNDNDFTATDVTIVDFLPDTVTFIEADEDIASGTYDPVEHTYTWIYPLLKPQETVSLEIVAQVNSDTAPGTMITNTAMISSNETPPATTSVETITYFQSLAFSVTIDGSDKDEIKRVGSKEEMTYTIQFYNKDNDSAVTNVSIVDTLPSTVSFVRARADDHNVTGQYDSKTHTYTWSYPSLEPTSMPITVDLVVQVDKNISPATIISNSITIDSDQTRPTTISVDAMTYYESLDLSTVVIGGIIGETEWVDVNETYSYKINFENNNDVPVTNVFIVDTLPKEIQFESATGEGSFGWYDPQAHTYTWFYSSLSPGDSDELEIVTRVNPGTAISTTITNLVTIDSDETLPTTTSVDVIVGESPLEARTFSILPAIIRDSGSSYDVQATAILPRGIGKDDIKDVRPTLNPCGISAKRQMILGNATTAKVIALFDKNDLVEAISDRGEITLTVVGKLVSDRSWYGTATVYITGYTGQ
ncbi:MAG: DUF11 domain-containing protein [Sedimentisphaerales bacterium]|nr:DUF11 domain-containing protein [Sedimentisphaerales bacterium]